VNVDGGARETKLFGFGTFGNRKYFYTIRAISLPLLSQIN